MHTKSSRILLAGLILPLLCDYGNADVVVQTSVGKLKGSKRDIGGKDLFEFVGVPFAKPPVGNLRFSKPEKVEPWQGIKDATKYGPSCMQSFEILDIRPLLPNKEMSEDCLSLNVYVPRILKSGPNYSVMIWIHGGGYVFGQAMLYDGAALAIHGDVIVVTVNYRLGAFGFLSTEDSAAPGNYGLWDQRMAFQWVKENIESFGGNSESVTIFGESAGGGSVSMQSISPTNAGLFQRSIMQSGSMFSSWSFIRKPSKIAFDVADIAGCLTSPKTSATDKTSVVECLRGIDAATLLNVANSIAPANTDPTFLSFFAPVKDGEFLPDTPENLLMNTDSPSFKVFNDVDLMAGTTNAEGAISIFPFFSMQQKSGFNLTEGIPIRILCNFIAPGLARDHFGGIAGVSDAICHHYTQDNIRELDLAAQGLRIANLLGDFQFVAPTVRALDIHSVSKRATYQYLFSHEADYTFIQLFPPWIKGSKHGDELPFVFGFSPFYPADFLISKEEQILSENMMRLWSNFAKTGNPNQPGSSKWAPYAKENKFYLNIDAVEPFQHLEERLYPDNMKLWLETIPSMLRSKEEL